MKSATLSFLPGNRKSFKTYILAGLISVLSLSAASAGVPDDIIAYYLGIEMGATAPNALAQGRLALKSKDPTLVQTTTFQAQLLEATRQALANPNGTSLGTVANKTTASAIALYSSKRIPQFSPLLGQYGTAAALNTSIVFKYPTQASQLTDAKKLADGVMVAGTKSYPKGTVNTAPYSIAAADVPDAASAITSQTIRAAAAITATAAVTVPALAGQVVKSAIKIQKLNSLSIDGSLTGFVAQITGTDNDDFSSSVLLQNVTVEAVKAGGTKYLSNVVTSITAAFAATYLETAVGIPTNANTFYTNNQNAIKAAITLALGTKFTPALQIAANQYILNGIGQAYTIPSLIPGAGGINDFDYNNGTGTPVTDVG